MAGAPLVFRASCTPDVYVSYRATDLHMPAHTCGVTKNQPITAGQGTASADKNSPGFREIGIAVVVDSLLYQKYSGDEEAENFILGLLALVQRDYDKGFDGRIQFQLTTLLLSRGGAPEGWSGSTDSGILLENFREFGNSPAFEVDYDIATLITDRDLNDRVIGKAYIDSMCDTNRYNIVQDRYPGALGQRVIWGHEIGHNLGAMHAPVGRYIMSPVAEQSNDRWAPGTVSAISEKLPEYACLQAFGWQYLRLNVLPQGVRLSWEFAAVDPHDGFLVQRALSPAGPWTDVSRVADFTSDEFLLTDTDLDFGQIYYYRVIQFATDGTPCISETRTINVPYRDGGRLSPNPTFGEVRVYSPDEAPRNYEMYSAVGQLLWRGAINQGFNLIDLGHLPAGVYVFVEESPDGERVVERVIRQ